MKQLIRIVTTHAVRDVFKHRSFCLLILFLFILDRFVNYDFDHGLVWPADSTFMAASEHLAHYVFERLPAAVAGLLFNYRTVVILVGLFFLKQLISMWPSSDMRHMHRNERGGFAVLKALLSLRWFQIVWDAIAVSTLCGVVGGWILGWFLVFRWAWQRAPWIGWLWLLGVLVFLATPVTLAGFSYSSKLAVLSRGSFTQKLGLFFKLFTDRRVLAASWLFYLIRQVVEVVFVVAIPAAILLSVSNPWLRVPLAALLATPFYSFIKMASFKFFLHIYRDDDLVRQEYREYYRSLT